MLGSRIAATPPGTCEPAFTLSTVTTPPCAVTKRTDSQWEDSDGEPKAALGRPAGEEEPVDGEVVRERSS